MGNDKKKGSRSWFFSSFLGKKESSTNEKVKMLTADGKLVEIDKEVLDNAIAKTKAGNREIFEWMNNPSK